MMLVQQNFCSFKLCKPSWSVLLAVLYATTWGAYGFTELYYFRLDAPHDSVHYPMQVEELIGFCAYGILFSLIVYAFLYYLLRKPTAPLLMKAVFEIVSITCIVSAVLTIALILISLMHSSSRSYYNNKMFYVALAVRGGFIIFIPLIGKSLNEFFSNEYEKTKMPNSYLVP